MTMPPLFRIGFTLLVAVAALGPRPATAQGLTECADIVVLARRFLAEAASLVGRSLVLTDAAAKVLTAAPWPGNVRQLQNEMQRAAALCAGSKIGAADLSPDIQ